MRESISLLSRLGVPDADALRRYVSHADKDTVPVGEFGDAIRNAIGGFIRHTLTRPATLIRPVN